MFGLAHCVYYHCLMNGSNHLQETDASPIHLCPVCLRKLHSSLRFDIVARYQGLEKVYAQTGLAAESAWLQQRVTFISWE